MRELTGELQNRKFDLLRLEACGFRRSQDVYRYVQRLPGLPFEMRVTVTGASAAAGVFDTETGEEYVLVDVPGAAGKFIGTLRAAYDEALGALLRACCVPDVFKSACTGAVIAYIRETYGDTPEHLWAKTPQNAVFRRKDTGKWYAALLTLPAENKLGTGGDAPVEILDFRAPPEMIDARVDGVRFFRGYHMNKTHWMTVKLDGSVPTETIYRDIDRSYTLA